MKDHKGNKEEMKKLDDIGKKNIYTTPEGYFDKLPEIIQSRVQEKPTASRQIWMVPGVRYAVAASIVLLIAYFGIFRTPETKELDYNQLLAEVSTFELVTYIESTDLTADEILDEINLDDNSFDKIFETEQEFLDEIYSDEELLSELDEFI